MKKKEMLSTDQVAEILGAPYQTVICWIKQGRLPGAYTEEESRGSVWRIPRAAVEQFSRPKRGRPLKPAPANGQPAKPAAARKKSGSKKKQEK